MRREDIWAMGPGRELDALVAEKVMGWTDFSPVDPTIDYGVGINGYRRNYAKDPESGRNVHFPHYSTDISAAWEIIEKITKKAEEDGCGPIVNITHDGAWHVKIGMFRAACGSAPEAICKASLLEALGLL